MIYIRLEEKIPIKKRTIISLADLHISAEVDNMY